MRFSRLGLAAIAAMVTLSACAPRFAPSLPDDPGNEATDGRQDRESDRNKQGSDAPSGDMTPADPPSAGEQKSILDRYPNLDPDRQIPRNLLASALKYFDDHASSVKNKAYIAVIDFSLPSTKRRLWIVDMSSGAVFATTVAHGKNSDKDNDGFAEAFSNTPDSNMSSLGVYLTAETYHGSHGLSLRLDGKSATNSNVRTRAIVVHGADYVQDREVRQGRSWGCPAVPMAYRDKVIAMLKGGVVMYVGQSAKE